jgi:hypothetical protein
MDLVVKVLAGGVMGGLLGFLVGRSTICSGAHCRSRGRMIFSIVGCAIFGAALAWHLSVRDG